MNYLTTDAELTATANAIRAKTGTSAPVTYAQTTGFASAISAIPSGGNVVAKAAFTKITNKTAYQNTNSVITIPSSGTWKISWIAYTSSSTSSSTKSKLTKNGTEVGDSHQALAYSSSSLKPYSETLTLSAGDEIMVKACTRSGTSYYICVIDIIAEKQ